MKKILFVFPLVLASCVSMFVPDFVQEEMKQSANFKKNHPDSFKTLKGEKRDIAFTQIGAAKAPKIVFVHGSPGDWGAFVQLMNRPALQKVAHLISVDRLGYGGSERGGVERSLDVQSREIMRVLDEDDPQQKVILVGHSYGGPVVTKMATLGDPRVVSIVILAGALDPSLEETKWYQIPADWWIFSWALPEELVVCNREIRALKSELEILGKEFDKITARITVVQGLKDELVHPANADYIEKKALGHPTQIIRLPEQNHFLQANENELTERILLEEIEKIHQP